jgi:hypothetical protein
MKLVRDILFYAVSYGYSVLCSSLLKFCSMNLVTETQFYVVGY